MLPRKVVCYIFVFLNNWVDPLTIFEQNYVKFFENQCSNTVVAIIFIQTFN